MKMIKLDITDTLGEVSGAVQLGFVGLVVMSGIGQMQVNLVNLLKDAIEIVLLSTMGEFEGFVFSNFDESLQPFLGGKDARDQAFDCLSVGGFVEVDIKRLIYCEGSMTLHSNALKEGNLVGFKSSLSLTSLVLNELFALLSQSSDVLLELFVGLLVLGGDPRCVGVDLGGSLGTS